MRRWFWCLAVAGVAGCGGSGGATPTSPTAAAPAAPTAAAYTLTVSVGNRPARVGALDAESGPLDDQIVKGTIFIVIEARETNKVDWGLMRLILKASGRNGTLQTETLDEAALRAIVTGGSLRAPGGTSLTIPYTPSFRFGRSDAVTIEVSGDFKDANGNESSVNSTPVPVPLDRMATCRADPNHLCLTDQRFQVDAFINGERATTMARVSDTEGAFEFGTARLLVSVVNNCLIRNSYAVRVVAATAAAFAYTVYVTDTLVNSTKTYTNPSGVVPPAMEDLTAFATCP